jgi:hypothetical protein
MEDLLDLIGSIPYVTWVPLGIGLVIALGLFTRSMRRREPQLPVPFRFTPLPVQPPGHAHAEDPWVRGSATERRRFVRRRGNPIDVVVRVDDESASASGIVVDRSHGGVGLEISREVAVGRRLLLRPSNVGDEAGWIEIEVRHCRPVGDSWRVGGPFTKALTASMQWLLG